MRRRDERGTEGISAILVLPTLFILLFGAIEACMYFQVRMQADGIMRDVTRGVAVDGGTNNPRTNVSGVDWRTWGVNHMKQPYMQPLYYSPPTITCDSATPPAAAPYTYVPAPGDTNYTSPATVVKKAGDVINCKAVIRYRPITFYFRGSAAKALGFDTFLGTYTLSWKATSETGSSS